MKCKMEKIEVKYRGVVVGHTYDNGKTIEFGNHIIADEIKRELSHETTIHISSRQKGIINDDNTVSDVKLKELDILPISLEDFKHNKK